MSWIEQIKDNLIITTGDGKLYQPDWMNASLALEFNITEFNFPNVAGTLVDRRQPLGRKYNLHIFFQGDNHLDISTAFMDSANDPRAWDLSHPMYGKITVQPSSLSVNRDAMNITEITGTVMETITTDNPKTSVVPADKIFADKQALDGVAAAEFANSTANLQPTSINTITANNAAYQAQAAKEVTDKQESETLLNLYNEAQSAMVQASAYPLIAIQKTQAFINYPPSLLSNPVTTRLQLLNDQLDNLNASVENIITKNDKVIYETTGASFLSNMALASGFPQPGNYGNRNQVLSVISTILTAYNAFMAYLDSLQTANAGSPTSYIPSADTITGLSGLMNYTISNLFNIA